MSLLSDPPRSSSLREEHLEVTRRSVLAALSRLLEHQRRADISFAAVAHEAQVSVRTVYRHFPTKEALFEAHWRQIYSEISLRSMPSTPEQLDSLIPKVIHRYEEHSATLRAYLEPDLGKDLAAVLQPQIAEALMQVVAEMHEHQVDETAKRWTAAAINCIFCPRGWLSLQQDWHMDEREIVEMIRWTAHRLLINLIHPQEQVT